MENRLITVLLSLLQINSLPNESTSPHIHYFLFTLRVEESLFVLRNFSSLNPWTSLKFPFACQKFLCLLAGGGGETVLLIAPWLCVELTKLNILFFFFLYFLG